MTESYARNALKHYDVAYSLKNKKSSLTLKFLAALQYGFNSKLLTARK